LTSKDLDFSHFIASFNVNNVTLTPGQCVTFTLSLTFDANTPDHGYNASIAILARSATGGSGTASFNLPVSIGACTVPEFPGTGAFVLIITVLTILGFIKFSNRRKNDFSPVTS
jgi:hypothetical protein